LTKESLTSKVATLTERITNLIETTKNNKVETIGRIDILCDKVNHQFTEITKRVSRLEERDLAEINKYRGKVEIYKAATALLGFILAIVGILKGLGMV